VEEVHCQAEGGRGRPPLILFSANFSRVILDVRSLGLVSCRTVIVANKN
jgi:hypothetical protein